MWVGHIKCENKYKEIDNLFSTDVLTLESKIKSKKIICEILKTKEQEKKEIIKVPLKSMLNVANKTVGKFISSLKESEQKELKKILSTPKTQLIENYNDAKDLVLEKLNEKKNNENDSDTINTIDQVLLKIQKESFSELNYFHLKQLKESL
jgi:spore germination cell wall hydrolase CwlJ-like protein